ncbi:hypothetical protein AMTR_s00069p00044130 [Amborella trichopoda]|uniref:Aluminum-activated malate transporter n=1 Tax=Amborella trichopoda TaxID=13333 RepID=U5DFU8_AMBTC|nr:hypothetical protein AMTR_s00069p00044130 [Amborella trichopoda]
MVVLNKEVSNQLEWRVTIGDGSSMQLRSDPRCFQTAWEWVFEVVLGWKMEVEELIQRICKIGKEDPRKVAHCFKVGLALTLVSLFYYMRPLYEGVGGNAMWAVMTVVVVFESSVGATLGKGLNRALGTILAGALGIGVHYVAEKSGPTIEPIILGLSVFLIASAATFSRFIPKVKQRYDYGVMIFILTFSLVSESGYRVEKLFDMAHERLSTVAIGSCACVLISMLICPTWAGQDLHKLIAKNLQKLAASLDGYVAEYFEEKDVEGISIIDKATLKGYKCVLNSKATEESLANFATWEPAHGNFGFRHPWKQYLKIGTTSRFSAYCIEALSACTSSEVQIPVTNVSPLIEVLPLVTMASLLIEIASRIETVVTAVEELAILADFKPCLDEKPQQKQAAVKTPTPPEQHDQDDVRKTLQMV